MTERERIYRQGVSHHRWNLPPHYRAHPLQKDYEDGYYGRPFNAKLRRSFARRLRQAFFELFGV